jgi:putative ABC transport system ATP-binding protein
VFQFGQLVPELTAADNVALPLLLNRADRKSAYAAAATWLDRLGLSGKGTRRTGELSGGEAQRVALARALALQPKVIFADEPTGSLDTLTGEKVMDLLTGLAREQGSTVVLITHDARVAAYADRVVMVRDGIVSADLGAAGKPAGRPVPRPPRRDDRERGPDRPWRARGLRRLLAIGACLGAWHSGGRFHRHRSRA